MPWHSMDEMTRAGFTSRRGIRYWEEQGLLGEVSRSDGETRRYTDEQLDKAKIIAAAQFGNFSLAEVKEMLEEYATDPEVHEAILSRLADQAMAAARLIENLPRPKVEAKEYDL